MTRYLMVMLGGGMGAAARLAVGLAIQSRMDGRFPWGTVFVNVSGSFLIGLITALLAEKMANPYWHPLLVVGFLGGFTTFSTFEYETFQLVRGTGAAWYGLANVLGSVVLGYIAVWIGSSLGRS
ncbi:MAG TPA: fluoride efflux transporter CrcB [Terriglobia bacterium]|nr:fluoride efflux transporter CrcB [Terriglobia bacterium]